MDDIPDCLDSCPNDFENDSDGDGVCGDVDVCPGFDDNLDTDLMEQQMVVISVHLILIMI